MEEDFDPKNHGIEEDEIAKIYAMRDMEYENKKWLRDQANDFYKDFENLDVNTSISEIYSLIKNKELTLSSVNLLLDNMILIFEESEEYERCHFCNQIKKGLNAKI